MSGCRPAREEKAPPRRDPGELMLRPHRRPSLTLVPADRESFTATAPGRTLPLTFQRSPDGRVTGFTLVAGRAPGVVFERQ